MDALTNYTNFKNDIKSAFKNLIDKYQLDLIEVYPGCYELINLNCALRFTYDRGDINCNIRPVSVFKNETESEYGYGINSVASYLLRSKNDLLSSKELVYDARLQLARYAEIVEKYLTQVLEGDFSWLNGYIEKKRKLNIKIKYVLEQLEHKNLIYKKLMDGDDTWENDLDNYLKKKDIRGNTD